MADDPYHVLGVEQGTDLAQIRRAYLARLRANHPDVRPGDVEAEERTRQLNQAWEQVQARHGRGPSSQRGAPRARPAAAAYSRHQRDFRSAFTTATLRLALLVLALGLVLVAFAR